MPKYRKKPVVIEAFRFPSEKWPDWFWGAVNNGIVTISEDDGAHVTTLEGKHKIEDGSFVIKGVKGELYACRADIFAETYEPA